MIDRDGSYPLSLFDGFQSLSSLTSIDVSLSVETEAELISYPPRLSTAKIELTCADPEVDGLHAAFVLSGFAFCSSLTRLELKLVDVPLVLTSIGSLKQLHHLAIDGFGMLHYTPATLHAIKTLPMLETLAIVYTADEMFWVNSNDLDPLWLTPLLTAPHQLQRLQSLHVDSFDLWDNDFCLQLLPSLASLTQLQPYLTSALALPVLAAFRQLQTLHLAFDAVTDIDAHENNEEVDAAYDGCVRLAVIVPHLTHCSLTELALTSVACDETSLVELCTLQPLLQVLHLKEAAVDSLQPLAMLPLLQQLTVDLTLYSQVPDLFDQICQCKMLQRLKLKNIDPPLSEVQKRLLHSLSPSAPLPQLRTFMCINRGQEDVHSSFF